MRFDAAGHESTGHHKLPRCPGRDHLSRDNRWSCDQLSCIRLYSSLLLGSNVQMASAGAKNWPPCQLDGHLSSQNAAQWTMSSRFASNAGTSLLRTSAVSFGEAKNRILEVARQATQKTHHIGSLCTGWLRIPMRKTCALQYLHIYASLKREPVFVSQLFHLMTTKVWALLGRLATPCAAAISTGVCCRRKKP